MIIRVFVICIVVLLAVGRASATLILVHDNGGPNHPDAYLSDPTFPLQVGDDFQLSQPYGITRVTWYGTYKGGDQLPNGPDHFSLRFFSFVGPTTPNTVPLADLNLIDVLRLPTTLTIANGAPVFSYQADFPSVNLPTGHHLLSIVNETTGQPEQWGWHLHGTASGSAFWQRFNNGTNWLGPFGSEMSFKISAVPEPGTGVGVLVLGLLAVGRRGRR